MTGRATWTDWSCSVSVVVEEATRVSAAEQLVRSLMRDVDRAASRFRVDSDLARVNARAGVLVPVSQLLLDLVDEGLDAARRTDGLVDPALGAALAELGYDDDIAVVRERRAGRSSSPVVSRRPDEVRVDRQLRRVGVAPGSQLDLGATAKAWTADQAARRIHQRLGTPALVEIGGDVSAAGIPTSPWRVDVAEVRGGPSERVGLDHGAVATSSVLARRWTHVDGTPGHHVVDPRTGRSTDGPWRTVTVWAPTAVEANTASTAALVLGHEAEDWLVDRGLTARLVDHEGSVRRLGAWPSETEEAA